MARRTEPPKPIYPVRHEFVAAMDNVLAQATLLLTSLDQALKLDAVSSKIAPLLRERHDGLHDAMYGKDAP